MPKIGDALKMAVEQKPDNITGEQTRARPASALMNPNRRRIYQHLCIHPCSRLGPIASGTSLSRSSAKWHLEVLVEADYVREFLVDGKSHYCPHGLVSAQNLQLFAALGNNNNAEVFKVVLQNPGFDAGMLASLLGISTSLARNSLSELLGIGLVSCVADGRYIRYFPTEKYRDAIRMEKGAHREFIRHLVGRLSREHLKPELGDLKGPNTVIAISILGQSDRIIVPRQAHPLLQQ
ncbi:MAG: helix-turn-helix domain-containing protein [Thermoplasmata archaeon]